MSNNKIDNVSLCDSECNHKWVRESIYVYHDEVGQPHYSIRDVCSKCGTVNITTQN